MYQFNQLEKNGVSASRHSFVKLLDLWESATAAEELVDAAGCFGQFCNVDTMYLMNCRHRNLTLNPENDAMT